MVFGEHLHHIRRTDCENTKREMEVIVLAQMCYFLVDEIHPITKDTGIVLYLTGGGLAVGDNGHSYHTYCAIGD